MLEIPADLLLPKNRRDRIDHTEWNALLRRAQRSVSGQSGYVDELSEVQGYQQIWKPPWFPCWTTQAIPAWSVFTLTTGETYDDSIPKLRAAQVTESTPRGHVLLTNGSEAGIADSYMLARFIGLIEPVKLKTAEQCTLNATCGPGLATWEAAQDGAGLVAVTPWDGTDLQWFVRSERASLIWGKLNGDLLAGGSAVMSVWRLDDTDTPEDTGADETVWDIMLATGKKLPSGATCVAALMDGHFCVISSGACPVNQ